jgi:hypothetical protein
MDVNLKGLGGFVETTEAIIKLNEDEAKKAASHDHNIKAQLLNTISMDKSRKGEKIFNGDDIKALDQLFTVLRGYSTPL